MGSLLIEAFWMFSFANFTPQTNEWWDSVVCHALSLLGYVWHTTRYSQFICFTSFGWHMEAVKPMFLFKGCVISVDGLFCRVAVFLQGWCNLTDWILMSQIITERRSHWRSWPTPEHNKWAQNFPFTIIVVGIVWNILRKVQRDPEFNE